MTYPTEPTSPTAGGTTPAHGGLLDQITNHLHHIPTATWIAAGGATIAAIAITKLARTKRTSHKPRQAKSDKVMTFLGAAVATGVVGTGMWAFFDQTLHITNVLLRGCLFAFFEIAMLASALRSRRFRLDQAATQQTGTDLNDAHEVDVDGLAVWVLAILSGTMAATDEQTFGGVLLRLVSPLVAAWLWERGLAGELRQFTRRKRKTSIARTLWERGLVALGLAEPTDRTMGERATARTLNRLARARFRVHALEATKANKLSLALARWTLRRRFLSAVNSVDLAGNASLRQSLQQRIAVLMDADRGTSADAVKGLDPWAPVTVNTSVINASATTVDGEVTEATDGSVLTGADADADADGAGDAHPVTPSPGHPVTPSPGHPVTRVNNQTVTTTPSPRQPVNRHPSIKPATADAARALSRELVEQARDGMTDQQVEQYAAGRAERVIDGGGSKTDAMRDYFYTCVAMGIEPQGTRMAQVVGASPGLGRGNAIKWRGDLAVGDAEAVLTQTLTQIAAERQATADASMTADGDAPSMTTVDRKDN